MQKGKAPRKPRQDVPPQLIEYPPLEDEPTAVESGGVSGGVEPTENRCWEFVIERGTGALTQAALSETVSGTRAREDIMLQSAKGVLGFVPRQIAEKILSACQGLSDVRLVGRVTRLLGVQVWVELCLVE